jgi:TonB family protein
MRITILTLILVSLLRAQVPSSTEKDMPAVVTFVAPPYPRLAYEARIMATSVTRIVVNREGVVTEVKTISGHPIFESDVVEALKGWRFKRSDREHALQVTCIFELTDYERCNGTDTPSLATLETHVSAELPSVVHIKTDTPCSISDHASKLH